MKKCELCKIQARTYCESDQASLCWNCDAKVHGANFLVARHSRTLLCNTCQSQTPWKASGAKLGHTFSVCETCVRGNHNNEEEEEELEDDDHVHADESPSPTMSSSSSIEEESATVTVFSSLKLKRMHENASDLSYSMVLNFFFFFSYHIFFFVLFSIYEGLGLISCVYNRTISAVHHLHGRRLVLTPIGL